MAWLGTYAAVPPSTRDEPCAEPAVGSVPGVAGRGSGSIVRMGSLAFGGGNGHPSACGRGAFVPPCDLIGRPELKRGTEGLSQGGPSLSMLFGNRSPPAYRSGAHRGPQIWRRVGSQR